MGIFKKKLTTLDLTAYGIGLIVGAGIYVLIAPTAQLLGNYMWLGFLLASISIMLTGTSYIWLSKKFPDEAAEYFIIKKIFKSKFFSFIVGWFLLSAQIVGIAAVSIGFADYIYPFLKMPKILSALLVIIGSVLINLMGVKETSKLNIVLTSIALLGLFVVILGSIFVHPNLSFTWNYPISNVFKASSLVFFAFLGFEGIINFAGETKKASKAIPKALISSVLITSFIYMLVAFSSTALVDYKTLSISPAPLSFAAYAAFGDIGFKFVAFSALFSTASTVLILSAIAPRVMWGMADDSQLPLVLSRVDPKGVPYVSTIIVGLIASIFVIIFQKIGIIAQIANFNMLMVYTIFNMASLKINYTNRNNLKSFISLLAFVSTLTLLVFLNVISIIVGIVGVVASIVFYIIKRK